MQDAAAWAGVAIAALTLGWAVTAVVMRRALKSATADATAAAAVAQLARRIDDQAAAHNQVHAEMQAQMREDRHATDQRLRWLETNVWYRQHSTGGP